MAETSEIIYVKGHPLSMWKRSGMPGLLSDAEVAVSAVLELPFTCRSDVRELRREVLPLSREGSGRPWVNNGIEIFPTIPQIDRDSGNIQGEINLNHIFDLDLIS